MPPFSLTGLPSGLALVLVHRVRGLGLPLGALPLVEGVEVVRLGGVDALFFDLHVAVGLSGWGEREREKGIGGMG